MFFCVSRRPPTPCKALKEWARGCVWVVQTWWWQVVQYEILNMRGASWSVHKPSLPPPLSAVKVKSTLEQRTEKMREWKPLSQVGFWQLNKNGWIGRLYWKLLPLSRVAFKKKKHFLKQGPQSERLLKRGWRQMEKLKDEWEKERKEEEKKKAFPHSTSAAFPWQQFSQRCHRQECLWCRVRIFDKVAATQKKPEGATEREKERGLHREIRGWVTRGK